MNNKEGVKLIREIIKDYDLETQAGKSDAWARLNGTALKTAFRDRRDVFLGNFNAKYHDIWKYAFENMILCMDGHCCNLDSKSEKKEADDTVELFAELSRHASIKELSLNEVFAWVSQNVLTPFEELDAQDIPNRTALGWLRFAKEKETEFRRLELRLAQSAGTGGGKRTQAIPDDVEEEDEADVADVEKAWSEL